MAQQFQNIIKPMSVDQYSDEFDQSDYTILREHPSLDYFCLSIKDTINVLSFNGKDRVDTYKVPKKNYVKKMKFNQSGDIMGILDKYGNVFFYRFNPHNTFPYPFALFWQESSEKIDDFCFLNNGSKFASISSHSKGYFAIWDLFLP